MEEDYAENSVSSEKAEVELLDRPRQENSGMCLEQILPSFDKKKYEVK